MSRATFYRLTRPPSKGGVQSVRRTRSRRALGSREIEQILDILHEIRFVDKSPAQIYAALLDEGIYLCSISSMYRILRSRKEVRERRAQVRRAVFVKPEHLATAPNQVWSWDITKLRGHKKWTYFYLYVIIDIYSRNVVGWMLADRESAELAKQLIEDTCHRQKVLNSDLIIHSDRGQAVNSKTLAMLYADLGITKSLNRPHVSNDNPFSESHFKTMKYHHLFPKEFGSQEDAKAFCQWFFNWYNYEHYHSGIGLMTPSTLHYGRAEECIQKRQIVLDEAYQLHPERFVKGKPKPLGIPDAVWINPPPKLNAEIVGDTISSVSIIGGAK